MSSHTHAHRFVARCRLISILLASHQHLHHLRLLLAHLLLLLLQPAHHSQDLSRYHHAEPVARVHDRITGLNLCEHLDVFTYVWSQKQNKEERNKPTTTTTTTATTATREHWGRWVTLPPHTHTHTHAGSLWGVCTPSSSCVSDSF